MDSPDPGGGDPGRGCSDLPGDLEKAEAVGMTQVEKRARQREASRKAWLNWLGLISCSRCGYHRTFAAIDAHHIGAKRFPIAVFIGGKPCNEENQILLTAELENCVWLCRNCHAEIHEGLKERLVQ